MEIFYIPNPINNTTSILILNCQGIFQIPRSHVTILASGQQPDRLSSTVHACVLT